MRGASGIAIRDGVKQEMGRLPRRRVSPLATPC